MHTTSPNVASGTKGEYFRDEFKVSIEARFNFRRPKFCLSVDLKLPISGISAIFGPSGSGKTTLLRIIAGLERGEGHLKVGSLVLQDAQTFIPPHQRAIGYIPQKPTLFSHLNIRENLEFAKKRTQHPIKKAQEIIALLKLEPLMARSPEQLSGGEQQRVAIARALLQDPSLLLLDEPLASVDTLHKNEILLFLRVLAEQGDIPMLYVTHSRNEFTSLADYLVLMEGGKIQQSGDLQDLLTRSDLPLATDPEAVNIIKAVVTKIDKTFGLSYLRFPGGELVLAEVGLKVGSQVRVKVGVKDIGITLQPTIEEASMLNILSAKVDQLLAIDPSQVLVTSSIGSTRLLTRVTKKSASNLALSVGKDIYLGIKSVALRTI